MKTILNLLLAWALMIVVPSPVAALNPGEHVSNFRLLDADGKSHELYSLSGMKAVVMMVQGNSCPIVRHAVPALRALRDQYQKQGVEFLLLNANLQDKRDDVAKESQEFGFDLPVLMDETQSVAESLGVTRTAEVFLIDPKSWALAYRGPIDDRLSYEKQRPAPHHLYLKDALDAVLAGRAVREPQVLGVGCLVNMPERDRRSKPTKTSGSAQ